MTIKETSGLLRLARQHVERALFAKDCDAARLNAEIAMATALIAVAEHLGLIAEALVTENARRYARDGTNDHEKAGRM